MRVAWDISREVRPLEKPMIRFCDSFVNAKIARIPFAGKPGGAVWLPKDRELSGSERKNTAPGRREFLRPGVFFVFCRSFSGSPHRDAYLASSRAFAVFSSRVSSPRWQ